MTFASCASLRESDKSTYYDHAFDDHNRAPASFGPPQQVATSTNIQDPLYQRTQADYYYSLGEAYSQDGETQKAIEAFRSTLVYDPKTIQVRMRLAAEHIKLGQINEALELCEQAVEKDPNYVEARLLLGGLYSTLKVYDKAVEQYESILKQKPNHPDASLYLAAVYSEQKKYDPAIKIFESLIHNPDYTSPHMAYYYIGRIRLEQKEEKYVKAAELAFKKALDIKPDFVEAVLTLGSYYTSLKKEDKAFELYQKYQKDRGPHYRISEILAQMYIEKQMYDEAYQQLEILENQSDDALNVKLKMALILIEKKMYAPAIKKLEEILVEASDSDKVRFYLAAVYEESKQDELAIKNFKKIPLQSPFYGEAIIHAAYLMKGSGDLEGALSLTEKAVQNKKDFPQLYAMYASLLDDKKEYVKAAMVLEEAMKGFPENAQLRFYYGTIQDRLGKRNKVIEEMKKVIDLDPNHVQGLNYLAFTWAEENINLEDAEKLARRASELEPQDGYILDTLGWILHKQNKFDSALKYLEAAYKLQPTVAVIAEHLGDTYIKMYMPEKGMKMYYRAVELETDQKKKAEIQQKISSLEKQKNLPERTPASLQGR